jgi:hypothetical protein
MTERRIGQVMFDRKRKTLFISSFITSLAGHPNYQS